ncbi:DUF6281 family protein [Streptomyces flaveolus]|uniref:DUF6281 family protein n=1 Tax=Streptomyces flaveolus TaxID=67297 RepID=UPI003570BF6A
MTGRPEGSCAIAALYGGRTCTQVANVDFTVGEALGPAEFPSCDLLAPLSRSRFADAPASGWPTRRATTCLSPCFCLRDAG